LVPAPAGPLDTSYPVPNYTYLELAFVLEAVLAARERFCMVELGASYGPWLVISHRATERSTALPTRLVGVEMVPDYYRWMEQHFRTNGIDPAQHLLLHSAVSDFEGEVEYRQDRPCDLDYGQNIARRNPGQVAPPDDAATVRVPCTTLPRILERVDDVDLLHVDAQGEEGRILSLGRERLARQVRRLFVATHGRALHRSLRAAFAGAVWRPVHDFPPHSRARTPYGDLELLDGVLAFVRRDVDDRRSER
jgi:FkbM family methyltransferase